ncbi:MAG: hypothetical protein AB3N28_09595 [Kordiimonas sp.]
MDLGLIFDWVLIAFLAGSGIYKVLGKEKVPAAKLDIAYHWIFIVGTLQLVAIYFVYMKVYLPVLVLVGTPYVFVAFKTAARKDHTATIALVVMTAIIAARWLIVDDIV